MSLSDQIPVEMTLPRLLCPEHGEHLRAGWPKGYVLIALRLFEAATEGPELAAACRELHPGEGALDPRWINEVTERRPLCYFVAEHVVLRALVDSGLGELVVCDACSTPRLGGPYTSGGRTLRLCFVCACRNGDEAHRAHPEGRP